MSELITDLDQANAELEAANIDVNEPATKAEVMKFTQNFFNVQATKFIKEYVDHQLKPANMQLAYMAVIFNTFMDYLTVVGLPIDPLKAVNAKLDNNDWKLFVERVAEASKKAQSDAAKKEASVAPAAYTGLESMASSTNPISYKLEQKEGTQAGN